MIGREGGRSLITTGFARGCQGRGVVVRVHSPTAFIRQRLIGARKRLFGVRKGIFVVRERLSRGSRCPYLDDVQDLVRRFATLVVSVHTALAQNVQD